MPSDNAIPRDGLNRKARRWTVKNANPESVFYRAAMDAIHHDALKEVDDAE